MVRSFFECIDVGSENCPCYLAETGDCLTCSRLAGLDYCDCRWQGVCIYNEYSWNQKKVKNPREEIATKIVDKKIFKGNIHVIVLQGNKYLCQRFKFPGTFIFARNSDYKEIYDVPLSVMYVDNEKDQIHIAVKVISAKTKAIVESKDELLIKGPYRNGIIGLKALERNVEGRMLILCRNMGLAPAVKLVDFYKGKKEIDLIMDDYRLEENFAQPYFKELGIVPLRRNFKNDEDLQEIKKIIKEGSYDSTIIFASDKYISFFEKLIEDKKNYAILNNSNMCCGEGICGACSYVDKNGEVIKMCKCQMKAKDKQKGEL